MKNSERNQGQSNHAHLDLELLSAYLDGEVRPEEAARVERHLQRCSTCVEELESLRWTVNLLREVSPVVAPHPLVIRYADVESEPARRRLTWPDWLVNRLQWATVATAVLAILMFSADLLNVGRSAGAPAALMAQTEKAAPMTVQEAPRAKNPAETPFHAERERGELNEPASGPPEVPAMPAGTAAPRLAAPQAHAQPPAGQPGVEAEQEAAPGAGVLNEAETTTQPAENQPQAFSAPEPTPVTDLSEQTSPPGRVPNWFRLAEVGLTGLFIVLLGFSLWARRQRAT